MLAGVPVSFHDESTGNVEWRRWDFADGTESRSRRPAHFWREPGFYTVALTVGDGSMESTAFRVFLVEANESAGTCESSADAVCLQDSRFQVQVEWWAADGAGGVGSVAYAGTNDTGVFWFFERENWEVLVKVLDGCAVNGRTWVYSAATTDLGYSIRVTDTVTGAVREYRNEPGMSAGAVTDAEAFHESCDGN